MTRLGPPFTYLIVYRSPQLITIPAFTLLDATFFEELREYGEYTWMLMISAPARANFRYGAQLVTTGSNQRPT